MRWVEHLARADMMTNLYKTVVVRENVIEQWTVMRRFLKEKT